MTARRLAPVLVAAAVLAAAGPARAESIAVTAPDPWWLVGAQATAIGQGNTRIKAPYSNPDRSIGPDPLFGWSLSVSLFGAVRPWAGGALVVQPEFAAGKGMPNATGIAAFPNGDMVRSPELGTRPFIPRFFFHQDIPLGPADMEVPAAGESRFLAPSGLGRVRAAPRLEITVGKVAMNDFFDHSPVASDPRHHFMNHGLWAQGAWDRAGDARGYTWAAVIALETRRFAVRGGAALMPAFAGGTDFDADIARAHSETVEGELRYTLFGRPGSVKVLGSMNRARMGNYRAAIAAARGAAPDVTAVRLPGAVKYGAGLLVDQQVTTDLALFFRAGFNDGQTETFAFAEIDRSLSLGGELSGRPWGRASDRLGLGVALSGLSDAHRDYLRAGGVGRELGDGRLDAGLEYVAELYYDYHLGKYVEITPDIQGCINPGMNRDRGPVAIFGLRVHGHL